jgi:hypothetical protein
MGASSLAFSQRPARSITMRSRTTAILTVALISLGAGPAAAQPQASPKRIEAENHAAAMRSVARFRQQIDAGTARVASPAPSAPPRTVTVVRAPVAGDGFDWTDGAIGAGLTAALLLTGAGVASARRTSSTLHRAS